LNITQNVYRIVDESLGLNGRSSTFSMNTALLGSIPELDSMTVLHLIAELETQLGLTVYDDDLSSSTFETLGSLVAFVNSKYLAA
jgi:acyl carrier protein